jgi:hypothetical protein
VLGSFRAGEEFVALEEAIGAALGRHDAKVCTTRDEEE